VRQGSVDFGITGLDVIEEKRGENGDILVLYDALGFGHCALTLAIPEAWETVSDIPSLRKFAGTLDHPLRVATKFPNLTRRFLVQHDIPHILIAAEGTLETAPTIGYADVISDLVSSGQTLKDNRLRALRDGVIQPSQAALIANRKALQTHPEVLEMARRLLEYIEAHLRAKENLLVIANMRGESPEGLAQKIFTETHVGGLQGPTISPVFVREGETKWFSVSVVVRRDNLPQAITELRLVGGAASSFLRSRTFSKKSRHATKAMLGLCRIGQSCSNNTISNCKTDYSQAHRRMNFPSAPRLDGIANLFGERLTPEEAVRTFEDVRIHGDSALQKWTRTLDG
jgi:ATP phosphoribosyltransferase